ncbi:carbohydrate-binding module family 21 protein [Conidiobolus coronatus NRRL 28638]|uniref:Carbohydrate-binding module family 21 protein n=1 Tax=Conidiobolus coronatus (strain ATCC 28846 / CBS 209.66 / NRRL 28638) TaxID=796925 RepID=A0A137P4S2_CONC2|nr:carbohydrate-binding module family 21 protein [Conidiobolus coronatus NRRL 28638]|eukprot:KXN69993.1 carbohydrate-binding module family 21 protein [Conidiobolus coronatus NRRL 28638]
MSSTFTTQTSYRPSLLSKQLGVSRASTKSPNNTKMTISLSTPAIIRKKSGEVVKSSLRTATSPKHEERRVQFSPNLERVRSFDYTKCPLTVSGFTPMSLKCTNFPSNNRSLPNDKALVLESIRLDKESHTIIGLIRVQNYGFEKSVNVRYTFDSWGSFSNINSHYNRSYPSPYPDQYDQDQFEFTLNIPEEYKHSDDSSIKHQLKFAIKYTVNGADHWDNNNHRDYCADIKPEVQVDPDSSYESSAFSSSPDYFSQKSPFHSRYDFKSSFSARTTPGFGRSVKLDTCSMFAAPTPVTTPNEINSNIQVNSQQGTYLPYGSSPTSAGSFGCSPVSYGSHFGSLGWVKPQNSFFDHITLDEFSNRSPPVL